MNVLVSGSTGFMGGAITRHLLDGGCSVRAMTRSISGARDRFSRSESGREALADGRLTLVEADVTRPDTLDEAVREIEAVVQAAQFTGAPVENPARGLTYMHVDRDGTLNLLGALARVYGRPTSDPTLARFPAGSPRFLYVSGITVSPEAVEPWNRAKWQAEEAVRGSGLAWTIVRSCWAYGRDDTALNRILGYSDRLPFVPIFGDGTATLTPVLVEDVGRLFAALVSDPEVGSDTTLALGGPDSLTLNEFLGLALSTMGRRRPILHIPKGLGKLQAALLQHLPSRPLTPGAVEFVSQGGAVTDADRRLLSEQLPGFVATPVRAGLAGYLGARPLDARPSSRY